MLDRVRVDGEAVALGEAPLGVLVGEQLPVESPAGCACADLRMGRAIVVRQNDSTPRTGRASTHAPTVDRCADRCRTSPALKCHIADPLLTVHSVARPGARRAAIWP